MPNRKEIKKQIKALSEELANLKKLLTATLPDKWKLSYIKEKNVLLLVDPNGVEVCFGIEDQPPKLAQLASYYVLHQVTKHNSEDGTPTVYAIILGSDKDTADAITLIVQDKWKEIRKSGRKEKDDKKDD